MLTIASNNIHIRGVKNSFTLTAGIFVSKISFNFIACTAFMHSGKPRFGFRGGGCGGQLAYKITYNYSCSWDTVYQVSNAIVNDTVNTSLIAFLTIAQIIGNACVRSL